MLSLCLALAATVASASEAEGEEEEEEEEEEEPVNRQLQVTTIILIISGLVCISIGFEEGKENLFEKTSANMKPIIVSLFGELTLLGFIGLIMFILFKQEAINDLSEAMFGEEDTIKELSETIHMALFLVMVIFLATDISLVYVGNQLEVKWKEWEDDAHRKDYVAEQLTSLLKTPLIAGHRVGLVGHKFAAYAALRRGFLTVQSKNDQELDTHFSFAEYLSIELGHTLAELVEVPKKTWLFLECIALAFWLFDMICPPYTQALCWIVFGFIPPVGGAVMYSKLLSIKWDVVFASATVVSKPNESSPRAGGGSGSSPPRPQADSPSKRSSLIPAHLYGATDDTFHHSVHPPHLGGTLNAEHDARFWYGNEMRAEFTLSVIRALILINSIYSAIFVMVYLPVLMKDTDFFAMLVLLAMAIVPVVVFGYALPQIIEIFALVTSVDTFKNHRTVEVVTRKQLTLDAFMALKLVEAMQRRALLSKAAALLADLESARAAGPVGQQRRNAPGGGGAAGSSRKNEQMDLLVHSPEPSADAAGASSSHDAAVMERARASTRRIFQLFDTDNSGSVTRQELADMFARVGATADATIVEEIANALDPNHDGEVDFDEFFRFVVALESLIEEEVGVEALMRGMFTTIDADGEGSITIREMTDHMRSLGQDVTVDDVFSIIHELGVDEDGSGSLDSEEFELMLTKLGVF